MINHKAKMYAHEGFAVHGMYKEIIFKLEHWEHLGRTGTLLWLT